MPSRCREPSRRALAEPQRISVVLPPNVGRLRLLVMVETAFLTVTVLASVVDAGLLSTSAFVLAPFGGAKQGRQVLTTLGLASVVLLAYAVIAATAIVVVLVATRRLLQGMGGHRVLTVSQVVLSALTGAFVATDVPGDLPGWFLAAVFVALPVSALLLLRSGSVRAHARRMSG